MVGPFHDHSANQQIFDFPTLPYLGPFGPRNPYSTTRMGYYVEIGLGYSRFVRHYSGNRSVKDGSAYAAFAFFS